jgi:hypothetical protein
MFERFFGESFRVNCVAFGSSFISLLPSPVYAQTPPYPGCFQVSAGEYNGLGDQAGGRFTAAPGEYLKKEEREAGRAHTFYWYCPPRVYDENTYIGSYFSLLMLKPTGWQQITERDKISGLITNQFFDSNDPLGFGLAAGYNFAPWNNNIVVGPFASIDWYKLSVNHTFSGGTFLGTTSHWVATAGVKAGVVTAQHLYIYGLAGAAWLNQDLNVNFATAASQNTTAPGFTLGLGGEYHPTSWSLFGKPVSVFAQYQHTWWSTANFNTPTSSPGFNYAFKREDDTIKLGLNIYLSAPTPPPTRAIISK